MKALSWWVSLRRLKGDCIFWNKNIIPRKHSSTDAIAGVFSRVAVIVNYGMKLLATSAGPVYSFNVSITTLPFHDMELRSCREIKSPLFHSWFLWSSKRKMVCSRKRQQLVFSRRQADSWHSDVPTLHVPQNTQPSLLAPSHPSPPTGDKAYWKLSSKPPRFQWQPPISEPQSLQAPANQAQTCRSRPSPAFSSVQAVI